MLSSGQFKEAKSKVIAIKEVTAETMEAFIHYLYLGTIEDKNQVEELFKLGSKYMIPDLKVSNSHLSLNYFDHFSRFNALTR